MPETKGNRARRMWEATQAKPKKPPPSIIRLEDISDDNIIINDNKNKVSNNRMIGRKRPRLEIPITTNNLLQSPPKKKKKNNNNILYPIFSSNNNNKNINNNNNTNSDSNDILLSTLQTRFGFSSFRSSQRKAINAILNKRDVLLLMPTGGGKSLCFQIPALILKKLVIVISPLIALMKNHCDSLKKKNINAKILNSSICQTEKNKIYETLEIYSSNTNNDKNKKKYKMIEILYTTPETLSNNNKFSNILNILCINNKIGLFAIDECHCISSWGHDFRPSYRNLNNLRINYRNIPIMALTATATITVRDDIIKSLKMNNTEIIICNFDRPNLYFSFKYIEDLKEIKKWIKKPNKNKKKKRRKRGKFNKNEITKINQKICDDINIFLNKYNYKNKVGLIYVFSRKDAETISFYLKKEYKINIESYHAGMSNKKKTEIQEKWQNGIINIIAATCAFGMGVDKKNVRFVIHSMINKCIDQYYQEIGRGGRDKKFTRILTYYSLNMLNKHKNIALKDSICKISKYRKRGKTKQEIKNMAMNNERYKQIINDLKYIQKFAEPNKCRREILLNYFNQNILNQNKNNNAYCCDFCDNPMKIKQIKLKYEKKRKGKENIISNDTDNDYINFDDDGDHDDDIQNMEINSNYDYNHNHNHNHNNYEMEIKDDNNNDYNEYNIKGMESNILLNPSLTANINGLKIESRENGLFQFLSVIEENIKNICNENNQFDVFTISQQKELEILNGSNTSFMYGLNLRKEIEIIAKCTQNGLLWNKQQNIMNVAVNTNINDNNSNNNSNDNNIDGIMNTAMDNINNININVNIEGIFELIMSFQTEREWMLTMLDMKDNFDGYNRWKKELENKYTANVNSLCLQYESELNGIKSLKNINNELNKERKLLLSLINRYNPNQRRQIIWNSDYEESKKLIKNCDHFEKQRIEIIKNMKSNPLSMNIKNDENEEEEEDDDDDDDLIVLSLNHKHENVQCLISMGFHSKIINKAWCLLKNDDKTKSILPDHPSFITQMLDKINVIQSN